MIDEENAPDATDLSDVALELFKGRCSYAGISPQQLAIECFRDATAFLKAKTAALAGELGMVAEDTNPLDIAFAPNLKRTHPINLMSRAWGDLRLVESTWADLDANPAAESYEPYSWGKPEVNQARALFPAVVNRAKQVTST